MDVITTLIHLWVNHCLIYLLSVYYKLPLILNIFKCKISKFSVFVYMKADKIIKPHAD